MYYEVPDNLRYRSEGKEFVAGTVRVACTECDELIVAARVGALVERMETEWSGASRQRRRDAVEHFHNVVTVRAPILSAPRPD
ncbi:MAG: hypothetical protein DLM58_23250 [Pseudonocardiales bacterium]|nr:MAG: hypothetical protein DLM58_23250 [Pseudonocardiales bacterium]